MVHQKFMGILQDGIKITNFDNSNGLQNLQPPVSQNTMVGPTV